jgi:hypothetical protein
MPVKFLVKVRHKARPFHRCKRFNLIFNFLERNSEKFRYFAVSCKYYRPIKIASKSSTVPPL